MTEMFMIRFKGGPLDGAEFAVKGGWPLPASIDDGDFGYSMPGGNYRKANESQLPPTPGVVRGAQYEWVERP